MTNLSGYGGCILMPLDKALEQARLSLMDGLTPLLDRILRAVSLQRSGEWLKIRALTQSD